MKKASLYIMSAVLLAACSKSPEAADAKRAETVSVKTLKIAEVEFTLPYEAEGIVAAKNTATVASKISGTIISSAVEVGKTVAKGDILATIEAGEISARLAAAEAETARIERELNRETALLGKGASTQSAVKDLRDALAAINARRAEAASFAAYTEISAPISGVIVAKFSDKGDLAMPGGWICEIADAKNLQIKVEIPAKIASVAAAVANASYKVFAGKNTYGATLAEISPRIDDFSKTRLFKFDVKNPEGLVLGECVRMEFPFEKIKSVAIPESCVSKMGQIDRAFVVENGVVKMRILRLGAKLPDGSFIVKSGLEAGDVAVESPSAAIREGVSVK